MSQPQPDKLLNLCANCGRQYDVTHLAAGRRVQCECGHRFAVVSHPPHTPRALKCSNCGGVLEADGRRCGYCRAEITLEELRLSCVCPKCFARLESDARFCMECGVEIAPQSLFALAEDLHCPRCNGALRRRELGNHSIVECSRCGGIWLPQETFVKLCERAEAQAVVAGQLSQPPLPGESLPTQRQGYIPCVACTQLMMRKNFATASGVIIDVCRAHGVWLDAHELERILEFVRDGGLDRARQKEITRLEDAQRRLKAERDARAGIEPIGLPLERTPRRELGVLGFQATLDALFDALF